MANSFRQIVEAPSQFFQELKNLIPWLSKLWRTLGQVEEWHEVGTSGEPGFANGWVNFGVGFATAAFYKDPWGQIYIKGFIKSGTIGTRPFLLPVGYRPAVTNYFSTTSNSAFGNFYIDTTGQIITQTGSNISYSINCSFRAA